MRTAGLVGLVVLGLTASPALIAPGYAQECSSSRPIERISISTSGQQGDARSELPAVDADGCIVAFKSFATTLIDSDHNDKVDVFVRDRRAGTTERVTVSAIPGQEPNGASAPPALVADGTRVAFGSDATNLITPVPGDFNTSRDIFVYDRTAETTLDITLVLNQDGEGRGGGFVPDAPPSFSPGGDRVAFTSAAPDLVPSRPDDPYNDVFVCQPSDCSGTIQAASVTAGKINPVNGDSGGPALSGALPSPPDQQYVVAFFSDANNLIDGDTNQVRDVFVRNLRTAVTERVSLAGDGSEANAASGLDGTIGITTDGCEVVFASDASNLAAGTPLAITQIFLRNRCTGETLLVSKNADGAPGDGPSHFPSISATGRFVAFQSGATNLLLPDAQDTNGVSDIFVVDLTNGSVRRVSLTDVGEPANAASFAPRISLDGTTVAFQSDAALVADDTNGVSDIYAAFNPLSLAATPTPTEAPASPTPTGTVAPPTATQTRTLTPTEPVRTGTPTPSPTNTSVSPTVTRVATATFTIPPVPTHTPTHTPTRTPTGVPTITPTSSTPTSGTTTPVSHRGGGGGGCSCRIDAGADAPVDLGFIPALGIPLLLWTWRKRLRRIH